MDLWIDTVKSVIEENDGIASAEKLQKAGVSRLMLYAGLTSGLLKRESHGNYSLAEREPDIYRVIQSRSDKVIFSHLTALYLQGVIEQDSDDIDVTVPQGDNVSKMKRDFENLRFHYCKKENWDLGLTQIATPGGYTVRAYDAERCICDLIRDKKNVESGGFYLAVREYFKRYCDAEKIIRYSEKMKVEDKVRTYMEILQE